MVFIKKIQISAKGQTAITIFDDGQVKPNVYIFSNYLFNILIIYILLTHFLWLLVYLFIYSFLSEFSENAPVN